MPTSPPAGASAFLPRGRGLASLREAAARCRGCDLYQAATQAVFGEGPPDARLMLVGEVPGDREDRLGHPFVGPAGRELDAAMSAAGIDRRAIYLTNAVKHFKFHERGKRRIHDKPTRAEIKACAPWLEAELETVAPQGVILLGATAVAAVLGPSVTLSSVRGGPIESPLAPIVIATTHPAAILRAPDATSRRELRESMTEDLALAKSLLGD
jgi:uracil-DNA glycosylase family protein